MDSDGEATKGGSIPASWVRLATGRSRREWTVRWMSNYIYGTIATLVAIAGLTFELHPEALTTACIVVIGATAIWLAHALSDLVATRADGKAETTLADVARELGRSWSIVSAALPATTIFLLAGLGVWTMRTAFWLADIVGVLALAVVGVATAGGSDRPLSRRIVYVVGLVVVGVTIVLLEAGVHLL